MLIIVIATRNRRAACAARSTACARCRAGGRLEIIVVDNASADDTGDTVKSAALDMPVDVRYLVEPTQGKSFAVNAGSYGRPRDYLAFTGRRRFVEPQWGRALVRKRCAVRASSRRRAGSCRTGRARRPPGLSSAGRSVDDCSRVRPRGRIPRLPVLRSVPTWDSVAPRSKVRPVPHRSRPGAAGIFRGRTRVRPAPAPRRRSGSPGRRMPSCGTCCSGKRTKRDVLPVLRLRRMWTRTSMAAAVGLGSYAGARGKRFAAWHEHRALVDRPGARGGVSSPESKPLAPPKRNGSLPPPEAARV